MLSVYFAVVLGFVAVLGFAAELLALNKQGRRSAQYLKLNLLLCHHNGHSHWDRSVAGVDSDWFFSRNDVTRFMLRSLPAPIKGSSVLLLVILNTLLWTPVLILGAFLKLLIPLSFIKKYATQILIASATNWVSINGWVMAVFLDIEWHVSELDDLSMDEWYFVNCNHQSWSDITIIQALLNRRIPMLKFFLKQELIWVPVIGVCWWALDFPFMKRHTQEAIRKNPRLAGKDLATTRKACEKFKTTPVSVFNFLEGTRFTPEKHARQQSPYTHLLKPKAGGAAFVLGSMGEQMRTMLDITIVYPDEKIGPWDLICGRITKVLVHVNKIDIPTEFLGKDYASDPIFKARFQEWLNQTWVDKDALISLMKEQHCAGKDLPGCA